MDINAEISDMRVALASLEAKAKAQQEPTLTPISFGSKAELAKALVDGRTFKTYSGLTLMHDASSAYSSPFRIMRDGEDVYPMLGVWDLYADLEEINAAPAEPWYLNIPNYVREYGGGWQADWEDADQAKYCLFYDYSRREWDIKTTYEYCVSGTVYMSPNCALELADKLNSGEVVL